MLNSIDAMPQGGKIFIHIKPQLSNPNEIEIVISDTGEGIPPDIIKRYLNRFFYDKNQREPDWDFPLFIVLSIITVAKSM